MRRYFHPKARLRPIVRTVVREDGKTDAFSHLKAETRRRDPLRDDLTQPRISELPNVRALSKPAISLKFESWALRFERGRSKKFPVPDLLFESR